MNHDEMLKYVAGCINYRIADMQKQDNLDGKTHYPMSDYVLWALEEVTANDGVTINVSIK